MCSFEMRYEFCNIWNSREYLFSVFYLLWFILLGHLIYFPSCLFYSVAVWSICRVESALSIPKVKKKIKTSKTQTYNGSLRNLCKCKSYTFVISKLLSFSKIIHFQLLFRNHESSHEEQLLSMQISSNKFVHINYELLGFSNIT